MAYILIPERWSRQPTYPYEVDYNNAIVDVGDLRHAWSPTKPTIRAADGRMAMAANALFTGKDADDLRAGLAVCELYRKSSTTASYTVWLGAWWNSGTWPTNLERANIETDSAGTACSAAIAHNDAAASAYTGFGGLPASGSQNQYALRWDGSSSSPLATAYKDGSSGGEFSAAGTFPWNTGHDRTVYAGSTALDIYATYLHVFGPNRKIPYADVLAELRKNPYQVFKPIKRRVWFGGGVAAALDGAATATATATATLTTAIPIAGAAAVVASATGALSTSLSLTGQSAGVSLVDGVLTTTISLSGSSLAQAMAAAGLSTAIPLSGSASGVATAAADLTTGSGLTGAATAQASALASLTTQISLSGAALAQALAAADLTTGSGLTGAATAQASAGGNLLTAIPLAGAAQAYSTASGGLTTIIAITGAAASFSAATGDLTIEVTFTGAAMAEALAGGELTTIIRLDGAAIAQAAAAGSLGSATPLPAIIPHRVGASRARFRVESRAATWKIRATT